MASEHRKTARNEHLPRCVKIIILVQAAIIMSFTVAMYQEYLSNMYLQAYIIGVFRSNLVADAMLSMVTISVFVIGTFTLLGSMTTRRVGKEWKTLSEESEEVLDMPVMPVLETVETAAHTPAGKRRSRSRKTSVTTDALFHSMTRHDQERSK